MFTWSRRHHLYIARIRLTIKYPRKLPCDGVTPASINFLRCSFSSQMPRDDRTQRPTREEEKFYRRREINFNFLNQLVNRASRTYFTFLWIFTWRGTRRNTTKPWVGKPEKLPILSRIFLDSITQEKRPCYFEQVFVFFIPFSFRQKLAADAKRGKLFSRTLIFKGRELFSSSTIITHHT